MKKLTASLLLFLIACQAVPVQQQSQTTSAVLTPAQKALQCNAVETLKVFVRAPDGTDLVLDKEHFLSLYTLAEKYIALKDSVKNASVEKNVIVTPQGNDTYNVTFKLNDEITITAVVHVNNDELNKLREKMKRLTTAEPQVQVKELKRGKKFEITMSIDEVKWTGVFDADVVSGWNWASYFAGVVTPLLIGMLWLLK